MDMATARLTVISSTPDGMREGPLFEPCRKKQCRKKLLTGGNIYNKKAPTFFGWKWRLSRRLSRLI